MINKEKIGFLLYYIILFLITGYIVHKPAFGIIDDHTLTSTLLIDKAIPFSIMPSIGRFFPLNGQELNILSYIFSPSSQIFYCFNALCLLLVNFCLSQSFFILFSSYLKQAKIYAYLATLLIIITPAFMTSWLRLFVPERMEFVFLSLFFYSYVLLYTKSTNKILLFRSLCFISSLITLFYKETAFILLGMFSFCHIIFSYWNKEKIFKIDFLVLLNCLIWILCYIIFVVLQKNGSAIYGASPHNLFLVFLKNLVNYSLNAPFLILCTSIFLCLRLYEILFKNKKIIALYDSMLIASYFFMITYLLLGISDLHYPLPAYIFAIPALSFFINLYRKKIFLKISIYLMCFIFIFNCIPLCIYYSVHYKFVPQNFQSTLAFLEWYTKNKNVNIFLENANRASNMEAYVSFQNWMKFYGIKNFDFYSDIPVDHSILGESNPDSPYSVFKNNDIVRKKSGDLVILQPYSNSLLTYQSIKDMEKKYRLLYISDKGINIPLLGIRMLIKWIGIEMTKKRHDFAFSYNIFGLPIYFYVYEVK